MNEFLCGACAVTASIVGLIFMRSWRLLGDRFFAFFAAAFWILSAAWIGLAFFPREDQPWVLSVRLLGFVLIIVAIVDKNRRAGT